jgi:hypothetical protein
MVLPPKVPQCMMRCPRLPNRYSRTYTRRSTHPSCRAHSLASLHPAVLCRGHSQPHSQTFTPPLTTTPLVAPETLPLSKIPPRSTFPDASLDASTRSPHAPCRTTTRNRLHRGALHIHTRSPQSHGAFAPPDGRAHTPALRFRAPARLSRSRLGSETRYEAPGHGGAVGGTRCGMCRGGGTCWEQVGRA